MGFREPCFIPARRQPSCRSCLTVTVWLVMATALMTVFTPLGHCATLIPDVCNGTNPVEYHRIYTAGSRTQRDAESSLGSKLVDPDCELVRIYTTLQVDNQTYAPGYCPGDGFEPAYTLEKNGSGLSLAFVYGRNSQYAETFLSIPVPTRYYSFGTLHAKDAWKADDHQTLKFTIRSDWQSQTCWDVSSTDQRLSFLTHVVNTTLTKCRSRVTQDWQEQEGWLSGNIYVRTPSNQRPDSIFSTFTTFVYGYVHKYRKCENHYTPEELSFDTGRGAFPLNFTVCSEWAELEVYSQTLYCFIGVVGLLTFIVVIYFGKLVDGPYLEEVSEGRRTFTSFWSIIALISGHHTPAPGQFYAGFPPTLTIAKLCEEITCKSHPLMFFTAKWLPSVFARSIIYGILSFLALFLPFCIGGQSQQVDTINPLVFCHPGARGAFTFMFFSSLGLLAWLFAAFLFMCHQNKQAMVTAISGTVRFILTEIRCFLARFKLPLVTPPQHRIFSISLATVSGANTQPQQLSRTAETVGVVLFGLFIILSFIAFLNLMLIVTFTIIGLTLYHTFLFVGILALVKVILIDIFHIRDLDETLSPDLAARKRAFDKALLLMQDTLEMDSLAAIINQSSGADNDNQSSGADNDLRESIRDFIDIYLQVPVNFNIVFFQFCKSDEKSWKDKIRRRYQGFLCRSVALSLIVSAAFLAIQMSLTVVNNSGSSFFKTWSLLILPGLVFLKPLVSRILSTYRETHDATHALLSIEAKCTMLRFIKKEIRTATAEAEEEPGLTVAGAIARALQAVRGAGTAGTTRGERVQAWGEHSV